MSLRESDIGKDQRPPARQPAADLELGPETKPGQRRKALQKTCSEARALMGRLEQKILDIEAACEQPLT